MHIKISKFYLEVMMSVPASFLSPLIPRVIFLNIKLDSFHGALATENVNVWCDVYIKEDRRVPHSRLSF
jgi:hypothetical protein